MLYFATNSSSVDVPAWLAVVVPTLIALLAVVILFGIYRNKVDRLEKDIEKYEKKIDKLRTDADTLLEFKIQAQKFIDQNIYSNRSPLSLTDYGKSLVNDSGFREIFENTKDDLVTMLEQQHPTSQYDAQEKARALMDGLTEYAPFELIKKYAFEHGADLGQILRAGALLLRDYYFTKHPEIVDPNEKY